MPPPTSPPSPNPTETQVSTTARLYADKETPPTYEVIDKMYKAHALGEPGISKEEELKNHVERYIHEKLSSAFRAGARW
jgi:hypothetical protein